MREERQAGEGGGHSERGREGREKGKATRGRTKETMRGRERERR